MRHLAIFVLAGFFAGVFARSFLATSPEFAFLLIILGALFGAIFYFRPSFSAFLLCTGIFLASFGLGALRYEIRDSRTSLAPFFESKGRNVVLSGWVTDDPQRGEKFTRAVFETDSAKILLTLPHFPEVKYGDRLQIEGKLKEPENFADFDWKSYLAKDNIYFEMFLPKILSREEGGGFWLKRFLFRVKHDFLENLSRVLPEPHGSFLAGLTVGEQSGLPQKLEEDFRKIGVIHIIVLSGYNISVIADSMLKLINFLPLAKIFRTLSASFGIAMFAVLTGGSSTVARAAIMGVLLLFARHSGKVYQALSALLFAAFVMVLVNPKILRFDVSFQLSFLATAGLIFLVPKLETYFEWFPNFWKLREHLLATLSTQIFVLPLLLSIGGTFSWVTIPANLLILSAVPATMFFGFLTGLSGFLSVSLSQLFSWPTYLLLAYELWIVKIFSCCA